ncbi:hypothetical protein LTR67_004578 [Exophiala xenobiotica]
MSFFKKLKDELKEMLHDDGDKDKQKQDPQNMDHPATDQHRDFDQNSNIYNQYPPYGQQPGPQLPPGWIAQWDGNSQRWYYLEQATGRTQWELWNVPPGGPPEFQQGYGHAMLAVPYMQGHGEHSREYYTDSGSGGQQKKGSGMGGMVAAGLGGAAIGAIAGHALGDSDSDDGAHAAPTGGAPYAAPSPTGGCPAAAPPTEPPHEYNPELSSSHQSSLQEAREDLEGARAEVADDSDPSSSDVEDLREAQEEYASEVESAHEELED